MPDGRLCVCPICNQHGYTQYPYTSFTNKHLHPIRRYLRGLTAGKRYTLWLAEYWQQIDSKR